MKVLVIGSGGREHALAWKLQQSSQIERLFIAPGNAGIKLETEIESVALLAKDQNSIVKFCKDVGINLVVIGPDQALADGLVDRLVKEGIPAFGPTAAAARIESSKAFAKDIMQKVGIPTARFSLFSHLEEVNKFLEKSDWSGWVIKADGLALGKGVVVCDSKDIARQTAEDFLSNKTLGDAGTNIVIEEKLLGKEVSAFHFCDGKEARFLGFACDYKQLQDGGKGPNTGGMGAYSPVDWLPEGIQNQITKEVVQPLLHEMRKQDIPFSGMLFTGLMITNDGPKVLEFNARFGDPETQALLPLLDEDLLPWLKACAHQELHTRPKDIRKKTLVSIHVTKASQGYPSHNLLLNEAISIDGDFFTQLKNSKEFLKIFFAGVNATEPGMNHLKTSGGRVLGITALAETKAAAKKKAYEAIKNISFKGAQMRNDIGD